jgi:membrane protease YdiL (CAAX protease family)
MSAFVFGGLHVFSSAETLIDLLYIIPYGAPGFVFAYMLSKTDNIFVPMGFHFMHNGILVALQILLLLVG